jgi:hypothetical protein
MCWAGCRSRNRPTDSAEEAFFPDPALWIPFAALIAQIVVATVITILVLRWQERAGLGRNRPVR